MNDTSIKIKSNMNELNPVSLNREKINIYLFSFKKNTYTIFHISLSWKKKLAARSNFKSNIDDFVKYLYNVYQ